jgi:hypothetical protein
MMIKEFAWEIGTLIFGGVVTVALLIGGHWAPWIRRLSRLKAYTFGVGAIMLGITIWHGLNGDWKGVIGSWVIAGAAGATVLAQYQIDRIAKAICKAEMAESVDDELSVSV